MSETDDTAKPAKSSSPAFRKLMFTLGVLVVFWLLFGQLVPRLMFNHRAQPPAPPPPISNELPLQNDAAIAELRARIDQLEARLKTFEDVIAATPHPAPVVPSDDAAIDEERAAQLEEKIGEQEAQLKVMQSKIDEAQAVGSRQLTALTAFGQLKDSVLRGDPYGLALERLKTLLPNPTAEAALARLAPFAEKGLSTSAALKISFEETVPKALAPGEYSLAGNLQSLIRIRKVGADQKGTDDESVLARAEAAMNRGDTGAALKEIAQLSAAAAGVFAPWVAQAEAHREARTALDALEMALTQPAPATP